MKIKIDSELSLNQEVWALNWGICGIDYVRYPKPEMIIKGAVKAIQVKITDFEIIINGYLVEFGEQKTRSYYPVNIGTFVFKSEEDLKAHYQRIREEHYKHNKY